MTALRGQSHEPNTGCSMTMHSCCLDSVRAPGCFWVQMLLVFCLVYISCFFLAPTCHYAMQRKTPEELEVIHYANQVASAAHVQVGITLFLCSRDVVALPVPGVQHSRKGSDLTNLRPHDIHRFELEIDLNQAQDLDVIAVQKQP